MAPSFREASFRTGMPFAGYLHQPRQTNDRCARSEPPEDLAPPRAA